MARCPERVAIAALVISALACEVEPDVTLEPPPDDSDLAAIQAWLVAGEYLEWERHEPPPPPGGASGSIVYLSPELAASLRSGVQEHAVGVAAVREIVDLEQGDVLLGWAYTHKLEAGTGAQGWLFYEVFDTTSDGVALVAERGATGCVGCHGDGVDFVRSRI